MSDYRTLKKRVAAQSVANMQTVRVTAPDAATFAVAAGLVVAAANARATALSDLALAEWLGEAPLGLTPNADDPIRIADAFGVILATTTGTDDPTARLDRLATSEPLSAAQGSWSEGLRRQGVDMWERGVADDACEVCQGLADGGPFPASLDMLIPHPTCTCVAMPASADGS